MDGLKKSASNGGHNSDRKKKNDNETKEKVNRTLLLRQQIEENRYAG